MGKAGHGLSTELAVFSMAEVLGVAGGAFSSVAEHSAGRLPLKTLSTTLRFLWGRPGFTRGVDAFEGERADALNAKALDRFCFRLAADRLFLNFFPLPVGVKFCFLKEVASCFLFLPFGVFLVGAIPGVYICLSRVSCECVI